MTIARPSLRFDFANAPGFIDSRATFGRASTATYVDRQGVLRTAAASTPRWDFDPATGLSRGLLFEPQRTNLFLRARELDNAAWTKTGMTVTANTSAAADGTMALETLAATAVGANVAQACTITAGNSITVSVYARASTSSHLLLSLNDGVNGVLCWFNLQAGTIGTHTAGTGTVLFAFKDIEACGGGLYRCSLTVTTSTSTAFAATFGPTAADGIGTAIGDVIFAGDAQFEATTTATSFIATSSTTVTRSADFLSVPTSGSWFNTTEGTMVVDFLVSRRTPTGSVVFGGIGDTFSNTIYLSRSNSSVFMTVLSGGTQQALIGKTLDWTIGERNRVAMAWRANDFCIVANGGTAALDTNGALPVTPVRLMVGAAPYAATGGSDCCEAISQVSYFPRRLAESVMQTLTAP
jgi:hypothetical protein